MKPRKNVILYSASEYGRSLLNFQLQTCCHVNVILADSSADVKYAVRTVDDPYCLIVLRSADEGKGFVSDLSGVEIPLLQIGDPAVHDMTELFATRSVAGNCIGDVLDAVKMICARRRGPKKQLLEAA